jgi:hypothetical protein
MPLLGNKKLDIMSTSEQTSKEYFRSLKIIYLALLLGINAWYSILLLS